MAEAEAAGNRRRRRRRSPMSLSPWLTCTFNRHRRLRNRRSRHTEGSATPTSTTHKTSASAWRKTARSTGIRRSTQGLGICAKRWAPETAWTIPTVTFLPARTPMPAQTRTSTKPCSGRNHRLLIRSTTWQSRSSKLQWSDQGRLAIPDFSSRCSFSRRRQASRCPTSPVKCTCRITRHSRDLPRMP